MRLILVALPIALVMLVPSPGSAQSLQSFQDLALRVNLDDRLRIEDQSGAKTTGRLTHLTRDEITIQTSAGEKRFSSAIVRVGPRARLAQERRADGNHACPTVVQIAEDPSGPVADLRRSW